MLNYFVVFLSLLFRSPSEEGFCSIKNTTTKDGESIGYTVFYSVGGIYAHAGSANFSCKLEQMNGRPVYHMISSGVSSSSYDWIYRVRDIYETYIDTLTMKPIKFYRNIQEGKRKKVENIRFNFQSNTAITDSGTYKVSSCIQDVLSAIYFARNLDFSSYKVDDKIPFKMFLENETHSLYLRYLGKEDIQTRYGKFHAIKFKPLLVEGTIFSGGEKMTVWVSDDAARVPVRIESPILIGSIKVDMTSVKGLRWSLSALKFLPPAKAGGD